VRRHTHRWTEGVNPRLVPIGEATSTRVDVKRRIIVGIDLSLRAAAAAKVVLPWDGDLEDVRTCIVGRDLGLAATPRERAERLEHIVNRLADFCTDATDIHLEEYAFAASGAHAHAIGEVGGSLKLWFRKHLDRDPLPVHSAAARKTMLQKLPRSEVKKFVVRNVKRLGSPATGWTDDQIDAFVVMNHGVMLAGGVALTFAGE